MVLVPFFEIPHRDRLDKNVKSRCVQMITRSTDNLVEGNQKYTIFRSQRQFWGPKINLILLLMIVAIEYEIQRKTFCNNTFSFIYVQQIFLSDIVSYFCLLSSKLFCKISNNSLSMFIKIIKAY